VEKEGSKISGRIFKLIEIKRADHRSLPTY
jgi:hypothetical protein